MDVKQKCLTSFCIFYIISVKDKYFTVMDRYTTSTLRAYYGNLLTDRQNEIVRLHFDEDISYGELAEMFNISRQAAYDAVKKGGELLASYEEKLHLVERDCVLHSLLDDISAANECGNKSAVDDAVARIKRVLEE